MSEAPVRPNKKRSLKAYLAIKSDIGEMISWYDGSSSFADSIIKELENLLHYEFDTILSKDVLKNAYYLDKQDLLELLKKLRKWSKIKHDSIWKCKDYSSKINSSANQAVADSIRMTLLDMYNCILRASREIELDRSNPFNEPSSKRGRFVSLSEFDLYAKSAESFRDDN